MAAAETVTSADGMTTGDVKRAFDFSATDFATIVTTTAYVDKSLMIRDVYNASSRILITAPPRFGKSTNLDMVKRFFEIEVDARGNPKNVLTTNNYKLFKDYNLEICKDICFLNEHFGKYPVVHIDFKPLGGVDDSAKIFNAFKIIIENSFNQHSYILQHSRKEQVFSEITAFDENDIRKYVFDGITKDLDEVNLANSFKHLSTILKSFFEKKVFVLIDSYDAFLDSPLFENNTDRKKMRSFVESSIGRLLNNVISVERVLITGVIPVIGEGFLCNENIIERYHFLDSHPFIKYYGLTSAEVDTVLSKVIECDEERRDVKNTINDFYDTYESCNREIRVYSVWSVLQYVCRRTIQSYWCERRYINKFKKCLKIEPIRLKLQKLLLGNDLQLDISQPLSMTDVLKVNSMIISDAVDEAEHLSIEGELFFVLLYHFGYLSVIKDLGMGEVCVNILSKKIKYELGKAIFDENRELYSSSYMDDILSALDAFQPDATGLDHKCETFRKSLSNFRDQGKFTFSDFLELLYVNLVTNAKYRREMEPTIELNGRTAVLLKNTHQVAICVTQTYWGGAMRAVHQVAATHIFEAKNNVRGKVIIAFGVGNKQIEIAYSYYFETGDNLQEVRSLPRSRTQ